MASSDITNMQKDALGGSAPSFIAQIGWNPVVLSFSTSQLYYTLHGENTPSTGGAYNDVAKNFALSLEADKLFDWVTPSVIYKYLASDRNFVDDNLISDNANGDMIFGGAGLTYHQFGAFATVTPPMLEGLGATVGYSTLVKQREDGWQRTVSGGIASWIPASYQYPVNYGIDLRLQYAGLPVLVGLTVTTHHNVSFASITGDAAPETLIVGFYSEDVPEFTTEGSFAMYNSLAAACKVLENLTIHAQFANRHIRTYYNFDGATRYIDTLNIASLYIGAFWQFSPMVSLRGGFAMRMDNYSSAFAARQSGAGIDQYGIPLALKIVF
jgi:hypothetical protein